LPETCSLTSRHAGKPDVCTFPDTSERDVVMKIAADRRQLLQQRDSCASQLVLVADPGLHQQLRRLDRAKAENDFTAGRGTQDSSLAPELDADRAAALE